MEGPGPPLPAASAARAAADALRARKEAFVTGHAGTSKWEIFCVSISYAMGGLFGACVAHKGRSAMSSRHCQPTSQRGCCHTCPPQTKHPPALTSPAPAAAAAQAWALPRLRALGAPPRAQRAVLWAIEAAGMVTPLVALTMSGADAVPVFLILLLLWVSLGLKIWLRLLRGPGARGQLAAIVQHLAEPRKW
jgi:hypothetical protein